MVPPFTERGHSAFLEHKFDHQADRAAYTQHLQDNKYQKLTRL